MESLKHRNCEIRIVPVQLGYRIRAYRLGTPFRTTYTVPYETANFFNETAWHFAGKTAIAQVIECVKNEIDSATRN